MQDYSIKIDDERDYTLCTQCHSSVQPYCNTSITTITSIITSSNTECQQIKISITNLKNTHHSTATLLSYKHLNCQKCGLYIKIHPQFDELTCSKIFICSNHNIPHKYCLCYHCGLLYGINPNQTSIDIINVLQSQLFNNEIQKEHENDEEISLEQEVNEYDDDYSMDDDKEKNVSQIDESYKNLIALKTKLNVLSRTDIKTMSCPSSPSLKNIVSNKRLCHSLRTSPLLNSSTPSPRVLGRTLDESEKKWMQYLSNKNKEKVTNDTAMSKLERQNKKLEELEKLQKELSEQKRNSEQFAKLLIRNGMCKTLKI